MSKLRDDLTARLRESRFGKDVFGPKIAQPAARWIHDHFPESGRSERDANATSLSAEPASATVDSDGETGTNSPAPRGGEGQANDSTRHAAVAQAVDAALSPGALAPASSSPASSSPAAAPHAAAAPAAAPDSLDDAVVGGSHTAADESAGLGTTPETAAAVPGAIAPEPASLRTFAGVIAMLKAVGQRIKSHDLVVVGAGIAFWGLLAIPATLFALVSIAGLVLDPETVREQVERNLSGLPDDAQSIITGQLEGVSGGSTGGLIAGLIVGLALAFWTASGAIAKLMGALNTIYETEETRNFVKLRGTAVLLTLGGIVFISSAIFLLAALPPIVANIDGIGPSASTFFTVLRFPVLGLVMVLALGVLYYLGPDRKATYRPVTVGATVAMVLWLVLSGLFTIYTSTVATYNETYGSIGGIVILLLWLFITAFVVLIGAEIHAYREVALRRRSNSSD